MAQLILTEEQARIVAGATEPIHLCDPRGNIVAILKPAFTAEDLAEAKQRLASDGPRCTSEQVQAHLRALQEEWDRTGGFDRDYMRAFLGRLQAEDAR
jgi:hypothetical protein